MQINNDIYNFKHCRSALDSNTNHDAEVSSLRGTAEDDALKTSEDIIKHMDCKLLVNMFLFSNFFSRYQNVVF